MGFSCVLAEVSSTAVAWARMTVGGLGLSGLLWKLLLLGGWRTGNMLIQVHWC